MLRVSHKFHHIFYLWLNTSYTHHIHLWLNTSICRFWVIDVMSFLCGASHRHEEMERKSFMHFFFSGINNLRVWPISIFKCCHSWLQNPENKGEGGAGKTIVLIVNSDFFFFLSAYGRKSIRENVGQVLLFHCNFQKSNHQITVTGPDF